MPEDEHHVERTIVGEAVTAYNREGCQRRAYSWANGVAVSIARGQITGIHNTDNNGG